MRDDFFVIYRDADGGALRGWLRGLSAAILVFALAMGAALVAFQRSVAPDARFEFGRVAEYEGVLVGDPVPLLVTRDRAYFLVNPLKYEFDTAVRAALHERNVRLRATLIERGEQAMLEVVEGSVEGLGSEPSAGLPALGAARAGTRLVGEIVDSKCYLGVMNPGHLKPHRACAVNCLRGGIPPILLTRDAAGESRQVVLVTADGVRLDEWILPWVAEPVEVTGALRRLGPLELLEVQEGGVRRLP